MRILLDESHPRHLAAELPTHEVRTVRQMGWSSLTNGELLERASGRFEVMLTADQNLEHQQNLGASISQSSYRWRLTTGSIRCGLSFRLSKSS